VKILDAYIMKIKETIERQCCQSQDLRKYCGERELLVDRFDPIFCIYCGQIWVHDKEMGPAGSYDPCLKKVRITSNLWE
jgi:hypothetical protein